MIRKIWNDRRGNMAAMGALLAIPLIFSVGLAVDNARLLNVKDQAQDASDAAALAAVKQPSMSDAEIQSLARSIFVANEEGTSEFAEDDVIVTRANDGSVTVEIDAKIESTFMKVGDFPKLDFSVTSTAAASSSSSSTPSGTSDLGCIFLTDPRNTGIDLEGDSSFIANCVAMINTRNTAIRTRDNGTASFYGICANGTLNPKVGSLTPTTTLSDCTVIVDPFDRMAAPSELTASCSSSSNLNVTSGTTHSQSPGVHCGSVRVRNGGTLELEAGTHFFKGGLDIDEGGVMEGDNVMVMLDKDTKTYTVEGTLDINGLQSGPHKGFVIYNENFGGASNKIVVGENANFRADGVIYLPNTKFQIDTAVNQFATQSILVSDRFQMEGNASFRAVIDPDAATPLPDNEHFVTDGPARLIN